MDPASTAALAIRDAIYTRIIGLTGLYKTVRITPLPTLQPNQLPAVSIFVLTEDESSDGDANVGFLKYINDTTIGISIARGFADPVYIQDSLDADVARIKDLLLTDAHFTWRVSRDGGGLFESIPRMKRTWVFSKDSESYLAEVRLEMTFRFREGWLPLIPDALVEVDVKMPDRNDGMPIESLIELPQP